MKKILKMIGVFSALILSILGLTSCFEAPDQALYGVIIDNEYELNKTEVIIPEE